MNKAQTAVILEKEELIAQLKLNIARANRRLGSLDDEKAELLESLPQWQDEIKKQLAEIKQVEGDKENVT